MKIEKIVLLLGIGTLLSLNLSARAAETATSHSLSLLKSVTLAELPGKAAALVSAADEKSLVSTTVDVVKAAIGLNPAAAAAIVGSIAAATPKAAATAAATAASLLPQQAAVLAQAAAGAAPKQAGQIVEAVCRIAPNAYKSVAKAVAAAVPTANREILAGVAAAIPSLKDAINNTLALYKGAVPSVNSVLAQTSIASSPSEVTLAAGSPVAHGITPPPPTSLGGPAPVILPNTSNEPGPNNGRNYANPDPVNGNPNP